MQSHEAEIQQPDQSERAPRRNRSFGVGAKKIICQTLSPYGEQGLSYPDFLKQMQSQFKYRFVKNANFFGYTTEQALDVLEDVLRYEIHGDTIVVFPQPQEQDSPYLQPLEPKKPRQKKVAFNQQQNAEPQQQQQQQRTAPAQSQAPRGAARKASSNGGRAVMSAGTAFPNQQVEEYHDEDDLPLPQRRRAQRKRNTRPEQQNVQPAVPQQVHTWKEKMRWDTSGI